MTFRTTSSLDGDSILSLKYDPRKAATYVLIHGNTQSVTSNLIDWLKEVQVLGGHPLLMVGLAFEHHHSQLRDRYRHTRSRYLNYSDKAFKISTATHTAFVSGEGMEGVDYTELHNTLEMSKQLIDVIHILSAEVKVLQSRIDDVTARISLIPGKYSLKREEYLKQTGVLITNNLWQLKSELAYLEVDIDGLKEGMNSLIGSVG